MGTEVLEEQFDEKERHSAKEDFEEIKKLSQENWTSKMEEEKKVEEEEEEEDRSSIYVKILFNYIQIIAILGTFQFNWPDEMTQLFTYNKQIVKATQEFFSMDCFLKK